MPKIILARDSKQCGRAKGYDTSGGDGDDDDGDDDDDDDDDDDTQVRAHGSRHMRAHKSRHIKAHIWHHTNERTHIKEHI